MLEAILEVKLVKVLFVCTGNICRSPTAEVVFRDIVKQTKQTLISHIDSAGTGAWHVGSPPDLRSQEAAKKRGLDLSNLRARQITGSDFMDFDYIVAMDNSNIVNLTVLCPPEFQFKLSLLMDYSKGTNQREVPDPYYGGVEGFGDVFDLIRVASTGLFYHIGKST